ncbi:voltage-gated potassium channel subunit beta-1 isoform X1 [Silurus asotus]|uniref:Voltage-gated potassium channel subunit beta-1 isoform X1 n=1 Tax=Silurus asotus TaxID=30991 RepID=A0AAD5FCV9_SILAS|nr:voltage-gated potassium channel subunit beta-1 isoform X1 [Silurus asotus]
MFAARTGTVGRGIPDEALRHRKQSAASLSGPRGQRSSQDSSRDSRRQSQHTVLAQARRVELIREIETKWYLKLCGLAKEDCVAFQTGMPYREGQGRSCDPLDTGRHITPGAKHSRQAGMPGK